MDWIVPEWPAPRNVRALSTTRSGGVSKAPYSSFNLGVHVGDDLMKVEENRRQLGLSLPSSPYWLNQIHSTHVIDLSNAAFADGPPDADASYTSQRETVALVMTADCLPVLFCDQSGSEVAAAHAGWRGLVDGVLENTVATFSAPAKEILAWLGPAIGPQEFEVGSEVRDAFIAFDAKAALAFTPKGEKWLADIYLLARQRLEALGVSAIYGGNWCTVSDAQRFFSYRRDGRTGRQASMIWLTDEGIN
ncbi:purine nucleoside phosphorylase YfiH [Thaumasiovibrio subtropicus]|uniref:purine nucleoside phosphorylase YfiH n=1 Tax=Thaumasiovibrio subtropicus TaxID=1891207 RepID=UPI000B35A417|nr:purine nucleoside phosphorylase YfiH [Thaumasiovibrio subtropicus]